MTDVLWQTFANANGAALEAEALYSAIIDLVDEGAVAGIRASDAGWNYDTWGDDGEWVASYCIQWIGIRNVGAGGASRGTLSIAISFYRPEDRAGIEWAGAQRAKLYVGVAPTAKAWNVDTLLLDGCGQSDVAEAKSPYRWFRTDAQDAWFFCVTLDAIDSRDAIRTEVMAPLSHLLAGKDEKVAFEECRATITTTA